MDVGRALITTIIDYNDLHIVTEAGIRADWFEDRDQCSVFKWIIEYYGRYSEVPTEIALKAEFPNFKLLNVAEPIEFYIDRFKLQHERSILMDAVIEVNAALDENDTKTARDAMSRGVQKAGREINVLVDDNAISKESRQARYEKYEEIRTHSGELTGITTGFSALDYVTSGLHPEQFILIGGAPKQGKSFMLLKMAIAAHDHGARILFASFEMSALQHLLRYDAMCAKLNSAKLRHGRLTDKEMKRLKRTMAMRRNLESFIITSDTSAMTTMSALAAKIEEHEPDIVYVDGIYLMENEVGAEPLSTQSYTSISRGAKRLAQRIKKPMVATTQALTPKLGKGGAVTMNSLGWSSAWSQDADLVLGAMAVPEGQMFMLNVVGGRDVSPCEMSLACNWDETSFEEVATGDEDDE